MVPKQRREQRRLPTKPTQPALTAVAAVIIQPVINDENERWITVEQRLRPLRLAFLIEPGNRRQALSAIEVCCGHWGGELCPIIPVYRRRPRWLAHHRPTPKDLRTAVSPGWVQAFEPDYLVEMTPGLAAGFGYDSRLVIDLAAVEGAEPGLHGYGVDVRDVYATAYDRRYRFTQRHSDRAVLCDPERVGDTLWTAVIFGMLTDGASFEHLRESYRRTFDPDHKRVGADNFTELLITDSPPLTPLTATMWGVEADRLSNGVLSICYSIQRPWWTSRFCGACALMDCCSTPFRCHTLVASPPR